MQFIAFVTQSTVHRSVTLGILLAAVLTTVPTNVRTYDMQSVEDVLPEGVTLDDITKVFKLGAAAIAFFTAVSAFS